MRGDSNCDFGVSSCTEEKYARIYSGKRQYAAEVALLRAYVLRTRLTTDPTRADLLVVPALFASACLLRGGGHSHFQCMVTEMSRAPDGFSAQSLFEHHLPFYNPRTAHRHLFFGTAGKRELPPLVQHQALLATLGPLWLSDGPGSACCLVPYLTADRELQPDEYEADTERERPVLVFMAGQLEEVTIEPRAADIISSFAEQLCLDEDRCHIIHSHFESDCSSCEHVVSK